MYVYICIYGIGIGFYLEPTSIVFERFWFCIFAPTEIGKTLYVSVLTVPVSIASTSCIFLVVILYRLALICVNSQVS